MPHSSKRFRFRLDFRSLFVFSTILGFCFGVLSIPIVFISNLIKIGPGHFFPEMILIVLVGAPATGIMTGVLMGVIGYPIYKWVSGRYSITYSGQAFLEDDSQ